MLRVSDAARGLARFAVYRAIRLWGLAFASRAVRRGGEEEGRRHERKVREKGAEEAEGRKRDGENGGRQGYQCGRWLLAAK